MSLQNREIRIVRTRSWLRTIQILHILTAFEGEVFREIEQAFQFVCASLNIIGKHIRPGTSVIDLSSSRLAVPMPHEGWVFSNEIFYPG